MFSGVVYEKTACSLLAELAKKELRRNVGKSESKAAQFWRNCFSKLAFSKLANVPNAALAAIVIVIWVGENSAPLETDGASFSTQSSASVIYEGFREDYSYQKTSPDELSCSGIEGSSSFIFEAAAIELCKPGLPSENGILTSRP